MKRIGRFLLRGWWACLSQPTHLSMALVLLGVAFLGAVRDWWPAWVGWWSALFGVTFCYSSFLAGKRRLEIATRSVAEIEARLVGRSLPRAGFSVERIFWYGAVDIGPAHCVLWLILRGDAEQIPPYTMIERLPRVPDEVLRDWLAGLHAEACGIFRSNGWGRGWPPPSVGFESESRASWSHFR
jgi:hypothetical protein